jgi:hypothetical protein
MEQNTWQTTCITCHLPIVAVVLRHGRGWVPIVTAVPELWFPSDLLFCAPLPGLLPFPTRYCFHHIGCSRTAAGELSASIHRVLVDVGVSCFRLPWGPSPLLVLTFH